MRKLFVLVLAVAAVAAGCGSSTRWPGNPEEMDAFEAAHRMISELQTFRAIATVEYHSNKGTNVYETIQHARITGEYRVEVTAPPHVAGSVTASDNNQIFQFNARVNGRVSLVAAETPERSQIFLTSFIKNYLQSATISVSVSEEEGVRTVLEASVPGGHHYMHTARLYVCSATTTPVQLIIADADGVSRIVVTYHVFEKNIQLNDGLFTL